MLGSLRLFMFEALEGFANVAFHGNVDVAFVVIPIEVDADVVTARPIFGYGVELL